MASEPYPDQEQRQIAGLRVANCHFSGNLAQIDGGAVYAYESTLNFIDCDWTGNRAGDDGGGFWMEMATVWPLSIWVLSTFEAWQADPGARPQ